MTRLNVKRPNTQQNQHHPTPPPPNLRNLLNHSNFEAEYVGILAKKPLADHLGLFVSWRVYGQLSLFVSIQNVFKHYSQMVLLMFE